MFWLLTSVTCPEAVEAVSAIPARNKDGRISYTSEEDAELKEILDLAYTMLRLLVVATPAQKEEGEDEGLSPIPQPVFVKPKAFYRGLGLVGDRWTFMDLAWEM